MFDYRKDYPINPKSSKHFAFPQKTLMVNIRKNPQDIPSFDGLNPFVFSVISQPLSCLTLRSAGNTPSPSASMSLADARCALDRAYWCSPSCSKSWSRSCSLFNIYIYTYFIYYIYKLNFILYYIYIILCIILYILCIICYLLFIIYIYSINMHLLTSSIYNEAYRCSYSYVSCTASIGIL